MNQPKLVQDVTSAKAKPAQDSPASSGFLKMELEHHIPVKKPGSVAPAKQFVEVNQPADKELDKILKDVSHDVKNLAKVTPNKRKFSIKSLLAKKTQAQTAAQPAAPSVLKSQKPLLIIAMAFIVGAALAAAAVYAFRQNHATPAKSSAAPSTVGTSSTSSDAIQAAGGTLIKPGDISDFTASLQSKIDQLNDTQDFSANDLSDQTLGL